MCSFHLEELSTKLIGILKFRAESPLYVGSGIPLVRRPLMRQPDGAIVIPSSSWKGAFRSIAEKLAKTMKLTGLEGLAVQLYEEKERVAYNIRKDEALKYLEKFEKALTSEEINEFKNLQETLLKLGYKEEIEKAKKEGRKTSMFYDMAENYLALHCPVGKLFGNTVVAGKLRFFDVVLRGIRTKTRAGVGIDRSFGGARPDILYFTELIPKGTLLDLRIIADNLKQGEADSRLLAEVFEWVKELGLQLGGRKSVGLGELKLLDEESEVYLVSLEDEGGLALANPIRHGKRLLFVDFLKWLKERCTL